MSIWNEKNFGFWKYFFSLGSRDFCVGNKRFIWKDSIKKITEG